MTSAVHTIRTILLPLAIGLIGALLFESLGVPAALLTGAVVAVTLAGLLGIDVEPHPLVRLLTFLFLGCRVGAAVRPEFFEKIESFGPSIVTMAICVVATMFASAVYLRAVHGFDRSTATLSAIPGALPFVLAMAASSDADKGRVAIVQVMRLICLVILLPILLTSLGLIGPIGLVAETGNVRWNELGLLLLAGSAGALLFKYLNAPAAAFFGGMAGGALAYGSGTLSSPIPTWTVEPAFVATGVIVGSMIAKTERRLIPSTTLAGLGSLLVGTALALAFSIPVARYLDLSLAQVWLAFAPGGADSMAVLTIALGLDAAYVGGLHVVRFLGLAILVPWWVSNIPKQAGSVDAASPATASSTSNAIEKNRSRQS